MLKKYVSSNTYNGKVKESNPGFEKSRQRIQKAIDAAFLELRAKIPGVAEHINSHLDRSKEPLSTYKFRPSDRIILKKS